MFNNAFNTFYLLLYGVKHMVNDYSDSESRKSLCYNYMDYFFQSAARIFYMHIHRQDSTYHSFYYTSRVALAEKRNMDRSHCTMSKCSTTKAITKTKKPIQ